MILNWSTVLVVVGLPGVAACQSQSAVCTRIGAIEHAPLVEVSGLAKSQTYDDVYWVHNDSGNGPFLFAVDAAGVPIVPPWLAARYHVGRDDAAHPHWPGIEVAGAVNIDWEDIAVADERIYIADMGNNGNARRDLGVYVINEPNPRATHRLRPLEFLPVRYPEQHRFPARHWYYDCEAVFVVGGVLYFVTKHRHAGEIVGFEPGAELYRLDTAHIDRENVLTFVGRHPDIEMPSAADVSPDGKRLAVLTAATLWLFDAPSAGDDWFSGASRTVALPPAVGKAEGVAWQGAARLRLVNERGVLFAIDVSREI